MFEQGNRVRVVDGPLAGHSGMVIKDERYAENTASVARDRVWVLLESGDNPQRFTAAELVAT